MPWLRDFPRLYAGTSNRRAPIERALAPHVDIADEKDQKEGEDLKEPRPAETAEGERPRIEERDLDVEEQEDHRHQIELDRVALARVADGGHAALIGRKLFRRRIAGAKQRRQPDHGPGKGEAEPDHDHDA